jgi:hypothetical protein
MQGIIGHASRGVGIKIGSQSQLFGFGIWIIIQILERMLYNI